MDAYMIGYGNSALLSLDVYLTISPRLRTGACSPEGKDLVSCCVLLTRSSDYADRQNALSQAYVLAARADNLFARTHSCVIADACTLNRQVADQVGASSREERGVQRPASRRVNEVEMLRDEQRLEAVNLHSTEQTLLCPHDNCSYSVHRSISLAL